MFVRNVPNNTQPSSSARFFDIAAIIGLCCALLAGCGGGGGGSPAADDGNDDIDNPPQPTCATPPAASGTLTISGTVSYDRVPTARGAGVELDYTATISQPARGVVVQALACNLSLIATAVTNESGQYSLQVGGGVPVMIRARAQLLSTTGARWNVNVADNTSNDAQYVLDGEMVTTTTANETRNLHAASGWGGTRYTSTRAAAPFAILDSIYSGMRKVAAVDAAINFPQLTVHWSPDNQLSDTEEPDASEGLLPASYYDFRTRDIYLLGRENQDTDEYDDHVILHEWGHYIEHNFSRSDNLGGAHSDASHLDARVAQSEGFGNAWSAIMTDDPFYIDTDGARQSGGFDFNIESDTIFGFRGWFKEFSVQQIIYDLYDSNADGADSLALGLAPIWQTLVSQMPNTPALVTIFSFIDGIKQIVPSSASAIDDITDEHDIDPINDTYGSAEDNWAGLVFPGVESTANVYETLVVNSPQSVCTFGTYGAYNGLGVYRYFRFTVATSRSYRFSVSANFNTTDAAPAIAIWKNGALIVENIATTPVTQALTSGDYVVEVFDVRNIEGDPLNETGNVVDTGIDVCFSVSVTAL